MSNSGLPQTGVELVAANLQGFLGSLDKGNAAVNTFGGRMEGVGKRTSAASEIMIGALRKVGEIALESLFKAGRALVGFGQDSLRLAGDFQSGMQQFQVAAGQDLDAKGLEQFHDLFLQLGKDLPVSTAEVQQAATEMVKGGLDPATLAAGGLKQNIQFAAAAMGGDLVGAAEISAKVVAGWAQVGATAAEKSDLLTHATDLLTKAANASSVDVHELSLGLFNVQATAKNAGIGLDDVTTVLAELAGDFASSSEAGNSMASFISRLHPTTKAATQAMESLGLVTKDGGNAFYDAQGNFVGFQKASEILKQSLAGLNNEQRQQIMQTIFQKDAMGVAAGLAARGAEGYDAMAASLQNAMGVAAAGTTIQAGYNTAVENAQGGLEALKITIGEKLLPFMTDFMNYMNGTVITTLIDVAGAIFGDDEAFAKLSPTLQGIVSVVDVVVADIQEIIGAFNEAGAGSSEFGESIGLLASDLGLPGEVIQDIVFALQALIAALGTSSDATRSMGSIVTTVVGNWQAEFDTLGAYIPGILRSISAITGDILAQMSTFWKNNGTEVTAVVNSALKTVGDIYNTVLQIVLTLVGNKLTVMAAYFHDHAAQIQTTIKGAWDIVSGIITAALALIQGVLHATLDAMHGDWGAVWKDIQDMSVTVTLALDKVIRGFLNIIAAAFGTSLDDILKVWDHNWNAMVDLVENVGWWEAGKRVIEGIQKGLNDAWDNLMHWFNKKVSSLVHTAMDAIGAHSPATAFVPIGEFATQGVMQGFENEWPNLMGLVGTLSDDLVNGMRDVGEQMQNAFADGFGATASIDRQMAKNLDKIGDIDDAFTRSVVTQDLATLQKKATDLFADPTTAAKYFKMVSDQEFETLKIRQQIADATTQLDKERLENQLVLISRAQDAELSQFYAQQTGQVSPLQAIADQINQLITQSGLGLIDNPIMGMLDQLAAQLSQPITAQTYVTPPMAANQYGAPQTSSSYSNQQTYNMPVYTNNTPDAIQQSWAVLQASMV